jgi:hypothetical protein
MTESIIGSLVIAAFIRIACSLDGCVMVTVEMLINFQLSIK